jgi:WXG100 family type VII secretion target
MTTPSSYDNVQISVQPDAINQAATSITSLTKDVANQIGTINETMTNLALSWTGGASDLASEVNTQWQAAVTALCGTQQDPEQGILPRIADGLTEAAQNYTNADEWVSSSFSNFTNQLTSSSGSGGPQSVLNSGSATGSNALTAITETFS